MVHHLKDGSHVNDLRLFEGTEAWVFDLDNTLYPRECDLFSQIDWKMTDYVAQLLDLPKDEARKVQKDYYRRHGTTLRGLMIENKIDPDHYLAAVHDIDYSPVPPNPALGEAIASLPGKKFVFTNGDVPHAERTLERLGFPGHFEDIFDIVGSDLIPKPNLAAYESFIARTGISPARAAMFEDLHRNLQVPHQLGMRTTLIVPTNTKDLFVEEWEMEGDNAPHVEFVTDDLASFLSSVAGMLAS